jgi:hypothetical protein
MRSMPVMPGVDMHGAPKLSRGTIPAAAAVVMLTIGTIYSWPRTVAMVGVTLWGLGNVLAGLATSTFGAPWLYAVPHQETDA